MHPARLPEREALDVAIAALADPDGNEFCVLTPF